MKLVLLIATLLSLLTDPSPSIIDDEVETLKEARGDAGGGDGWLQYEWYGATLRDPGEIVRAPRCAEIFEVDVDANHR